MKASKAIKKSTVNRKPKQKINVGAWALIVLGVLFLIQNLFGLTFENLWPVFLIAIGVVILWNQSS